MTSGSVTVMDAAVICPHGNCDETSAPVNWAIATVAVSLLLLRHEGAGEEELVPCLDEEQDGGGEDAGAASGATMRTKVCIRVQPSTRADSSNSSGSSRKKALSVQMHRGSVKVTFGRMSER
jgi:hypothetical protein